MSDLNSVTLMGQVSSSIQVFSNETRKVMKFSVQTVEIWYKDEVQREKVENHSIVIYNNKVIDNIEARLTENSCVYIEGKMKYEKTENDKKSFIVVDIIDGDLKIITVDKKDHVNKISLIGRVGADPEFSNTNDNKRIAKFSFATSEKWKDRITGELKEKTDWHKIVCYNSKIVQNIENYVKKGKFLHMWGKIKTENWVDNSGQNKSNVVVVLDLLRSRLDFLDTKNSSYSNNSNNSNNTEKPQAKTTSNFSDFDEIDF